MASDNSDVVHDPLQAADPIGLPNNNLLPLTLRLDRSNYSFWRALVLAAVQAYNIDGSFLGTVLPPPRVLEGNILNPHYAHWLRLDQFLMHWLMNSISENMLGHIVHCHSSAEI